MTELPHTQRFLLAASGLHHTRELLVSVANVAIIETRKFDGQERTVRSISTDEVIGAVKSPASTLELEIFLLPRVKANRKEIRRKLVRVGFRFDSADIVENAVLALREVATFNPSFTSPRLGELLVIYNPWGGAGRSKFILDSKVRPLLEAAGLRLRTLETTHAGHALEIGRSHDPASVDGIVCISGDGLIQELVSGLLSRPDWRMVIRRVAFCHVAAGTSNALARGLRTQNPEQACYCLIKHKIRPLDAALISNGAGLRTISLCGAGYGIPASISVDSETHRHLGTFRYAWLKAKHGVLITLGIEKFYARLEYSADLALDDKALALYFSKPFAQQHRIQRYGRAGRTAIVPATTDIGDAATAAAAADTGGTDGDSSSGQESERSPRVGAGGSTGGTSGSRGPKPADEDNAAAPPELWHQSRCHDIATMRISGSALAQYLGSGEASKAAADAAYTSLPDPHKPMTRGGGRVCGRDSMNELDFDEILKKYTLAGAAGAAAPQASNEALSAAVPTTAPIPVEDPSIGGGPALAGSPSELRAVAAAEGSEKEDVTVNIAATEPLIDKTAKASPDAGSAPKQEPAFPFSDRSMVAPSPSVCGIVNFAAPTAKVVGALQQEEAMAAKEKRRRQRELIEALQDSVGYGVVGLSGLAAIARGTTTDLNVPVPVFVKREAGDTEPQGSARSTTMPSAGASSPSDQASGEEGMPSAKKQPGLAGLAARSLLEEPSVVKASQLQEQTLDDDIVHISPTPHASAAPSVTSAAASFMSPLPSPMPSGAQPLQPGQLQPGHHERYGDLHRGLADLDRLNPWEVVQRLRKASKLQQGQGLQYGAVIDSPSSSIFSPQQAPHFSPKTQRGNTNAPQGKTMKRQTSAPPEAGEHERLQQALVPSPNASGRERSTTVVLVSAQQPDDQPRRQVLRPPRQPKQAGALSLHQQALQNKHRAAKDDQWIGLRSPSEVSTVKHEGKSAAAVQAQVTSKRKVSEQAGQPSGFPTSSSDVVPQAAQTMQAVPGSEYVLMPPASLPPPSSKPLGAPAEIVGRQPSAVTPLPAALVAATEHVSAGDSIAIPVGAGPDASNPMAALDTDAKRSTHAQPQTSLELMHSLSHQQDEPYDALLSAKQTSQPARNPKDEAQASGAGPSSSTATKTASRPLYPPKLRTQSDSALLSIVSNAALTPAEAEPLLPVPSELLPPVPVTATAPVPPALRVRPRPNGGFGDLVACRPGCETCKKNGHLRFVGPRTVAIRFAAPTAATLAPGGGAADSVAGAFGEGYSISAIQQEEDAEFERLQGGATVTTHGRSLGFTGHRPSAASSFIHRLFAKPYHSAEEAAWKFKNRTKATGKGKGRNASTRGPESGFLEASERAAGAMESPEEETDVEPAFSSEILSPTGVRLTQPLIGRGARAPPAASSSYRTTATPELTPSSSSSGPPPIVLVPVESPTNANDEASATAQQAQKPKASWPGRLKGLFSSKPQSTAAVPDATASSQGPQRSASFTNRASQMILGSWPQRPEVAYSSRGFEKRRETGRYVTVGVVNVGPDAAFTHPSDSYLDLIIARRGGLGATLGLLGRYLLAPTGITNERNSPLLTMVKARSIVITPVGSSANSVGRAARYQCLNVDGEVLPGPPPFRIHLLPSFLSVFGEY